MLAVSQCPICQGKNFSQYISCKDYTVSHETFQIVKCDSCGLLITSPRPVDSKLGQYYLSEDYISHSNKSNSLIGRIYKISRGFALNWKVDLVRSAVKPLSSSPKLLDFGCGTGEFLLKASQKGFEVTGVEPSEIARNQATALTGSQIRVDLSKIDETFDVITLWHVLEHIPDLNNIVAQLTKRLKKNGTIFIAVPNHQSLDAARYKKDWAGYDVPRHLWHFNQATMERLLNNHTLRMEKILPMKLDAFYVSLLSEKYLKGENSMGGMINAFISGSKSNRSAKKTNEYSSLIYLARK